MIFIYRPQVIIFMLLIVVFLGRKWLGEIKLKLSCVLHDVLLARLLFASAFNLEVRSFPLAFSVSLSQITILPNNTSMRHCEFPMIQ